MANLTYVDKLQLEKLLGLGSGYVLNFSDKTFQEFVFESISIDMYAPENGRRRYFKSETAPLLLEGTAQPGRR